MQKHIAHIVLIFMLAIAPMQTVLAGLAVLDQAHKCDMGNMAQAMHSEMGHVNTNDSAVETDTRCHCHGDCQTVCGSSGHISFFMNIEELKLPVAESAVIPGYSVAINSQYPPTDIRPPIVLH